VRTDNGNSICDMPRILDKRVPGCTTAATWELFCTIEGRAYSFCGHCGSEWKRRVQVNAKLQGRCPNCSKHEPTPAVVPIDQHPVHPVTDIFHAAIDHAMKMEGILEPDRNKVLARLAYEAPWMCQEEAS
jgi:hypothetical protein